MLKTVLLVAALGLLISLSTAQQVLVYNWCDFDVHGWNVVQGWDPTWGPAEFTVSPNCTWTGNAGRPAIGGVSLKFAKTPYIAESDMSQTKILQMEYGYWWDRVVYDLSYVDCQPYNQCPFNWHRHKLETTNSDCPATGCKSSESQCRGGYQWDKDDTKMHTCLDPTTNLVLHLCMEQAPEDRYSGYESEEMDEIGVTINKKRPTGCSRKYYGQSIGGDENCYDGHITCSQWHRPHAGETCKAVWERYGIDWPTFHEWNPSVGNDCRHMNAGERYCVSIQSKRRRRYAA